MTEPGYPPEQNPPSLPPCCAEARAGGFQKGLLSSAHARLEMVRVMLNRDLKQTTRYMKAVLMLRRLCDSLPATSLCPNNGEVHSAREFLKQVDVEVKASVESALATPPADRPKPPSEGGPFQRDELRDLLHRMCQGVVEEIEVTAMRGMLEDVANSGVEHDDKRIDYVTVQIDRKLWDILGVFKNG